MMEWLRRFRMAAVVKRENRKGKEGNSFKQETRLMLRLGDNGLDTLFEA